MICFNHTQTHYFVCGYGVSLERTRNERWNENSGDHGRMGMPGSFRMLVWAWRANSLGTVMGDFHNPHRHTIDDDRPDSADWGWDWYSNLTNGKHRTWGMPTVKKFENINFVAKNDHPGVIRRILNWINDG